MISLGNSISFYEKRIIATDFRARVLSLGVVNQTIDYHSRKKTFG